MSSLPDAISLNDTETLKRLWAFGITINALVASGEYKFDTSPGSAPQIEIEAAPKIKTNQYQGELF